MLKRLTNTKNDAINLASARKPMAKVAGAVRQHGGMRLIGREKARHVRLVGFEFKASLNQIVAL